MTEGNEFSLCNSDDINNTFKSNNHYVKNGLQEHFLFYKFCTKDVLSLKYISFNSNISTKRQLTAELAL